MATRNETRRRSPDSVPAASHGDVALKPGHAAPGQGVAPESLDETFRQVDRLVHAGMAQASFGISPISLLQALQDWGVHLAISPGKQYELYVKAIEKSARLATFLASCIERKGLSQPCISPLPQDRRFGHSGWQVFPFSAYQQSFLLWQQWWHNATSDVHGVSAKHERLVEFYSRQFLDMLSPSNFVGSNPEVLSKTMGEGGSNLWAGLANLVDDLARQSAGRPAAGTDHFRPGLEVAATPGDVVYRNEFIELIQYRPVTETVKSEPILIVPAWIMKYYILDLSPHNSLIRYLVAQGFTVFCISWRNPGREQREWSIDHYRSHGVMAAIDAISDVTSGAKVHAVGYCLGGTLLSIAASAMARDGDDRLKSLSLIAAQIDFEEPGELGLFIDESQVSMLEDLMWSEGFLDQRRMAGTFQMLHSQDLIWSRIVREYLIGERPPMSDLMAWNADATRMPYRMQSEYLRQLYLGNDLSQGRFQVDGRPVHVEDIKVPVFALGTVTDHVAPWRSVFKLTHLLDTDIDFVLTSGGHNAGVVSEPGHPGRSYKRLQHVSGQPHPDPETWSASAAAVDGSWWREWADWLALHSGAGIPPLPAGGGTGRYRPVCTAPGTYVLEP
ncbi:alpha/beta fold hydrolase [Mesorhizobium qingshengii]|uniref:Alpha/beta fold hydrolase n=1 Tax=Mesorhizobium qingshengii TaxID=1165689 RepID=A0ABT4QXN2_9HYPH|nr:alpha/beta fold hydrolase [Mesorhizobium qingshengii]MCZ8546235.1 alpha/beta fold hydrolase [Mesorhizobium qingshengii]